jgi:DDE superfamily endonuclease
MQAKWLWSLWQGLLRRFAWAFTAPGWRRFAEWLTGLALNAEEHTVTQSLVALGRPDDWKALETFAEVGRWQGPALEFQATRLLEEAPGRLWHGYRVSAIDDTKVHRSSKGVWGTCTFHEYTARCPNRAQTVRAHNWVVLGGLLHNGGGPAWFLPLAARLYFRRSQLPRGEAFRTKCDLAVELARQQARDAGGRHLAAFDGGFALRSVVRRLADPEPGQPRVEFVTRLRHDARLHARPQAEASRPGPRRKWGRRLPPPRQGGRWPGGWQQGEAWVYGRKRQVRWKEVVCLWRVSGPAVPVKAVVAEVEGYKRRFTLASSAVELTGLQLLELFCARYRQEDGFRDLKQRLGWEEGRAWTREPILRTTQALLLVLTLLRLLQFRLDQDAADWWEAPPWDKRKGRPSVRDAARLLARHRGEFQRFLREMLDDGENTAGAEPVRVAM